MVNKTPKIYFVNTFVCMKVFLRFIMNMYVLNLRKEQFGLFSRVISSYTRGGRPEKIIVFTLTFTDIF